MRKAIFFCLLSILAAVIFWQGCASLPKVKRGLYLNKIVFADQPADYEKAVERENHVAWFVDNELFIPEELVLSGETAVSDVSTDDGYVFFYQVESWHPLIEIGMHKIEMRLVDKMTEKQLQFDISFELRMPTDYAI